MPNPMVRTVLLPDLARRLLRNMDARSEAKRTLSSVLSMVILQFQEDIL